MRITIVGTAGYVGLVTAASLADDGHDVIGVDIRNDKIESLRKGVMPFYERGLEELVRRGTERNLLHFTTDLPLALKDAEVAFLAVGTPPGADGHYDMKAAFSAAGDIGRFMQNELFVVTKSTVNLGDHIKLKECIATQLRERGSALPWHYVSNPEFLAQGSAIDNAQKPDRIVVGVEDDRSAEVMRELYASKTQNRAPFLRMTPSEAEMVKLGANSYFAMRITFFNQLARVCDTTGCNVYNVRDGIITDHRFGTDKMSHPGPGYAGSCFPKDTEAFAAQCRELGAPVTLIEGVVKANAEMRNYMPTKMIKYYDGDLTGKRIALLGLAFKPGTDDVRDTAASNLVEMLVPQGASVVAYDPHAAVAARQTPWGEKIAYAPTVWECIKGADAVVIMTDHNEFKQLDLRRMKADLKHPVIFDARNLYGRPQASKTYKLKELGFTYLGIGTEVHE